MLSLVIFAICLFVGAAASLALLFPGQEQAAETSGAGQLEAASGRSAAA